MEKIKGIAHRFTQIKKIVTDCSISINKQQKKILKLDLCKSVSSANICVQIFQTEVNYGT